MKTPPDSFQILYVSNSKADAIIAPVVSVYPLLIKFIVPCLPTEKKRHWTVDVVHY